MKKRFIKNQVDKSLKTKSQQVLKLQWEQNKIDCKSILKQKKAEIL